MAEIIQAAPENDKTRQDQFARKADVLDEVGEAYQPTPEDIALAAEVDRKFAEWKKDRQTHEPQWFTNNAFMRGNHEVRWSSLDNKLVNTNSVIPQRSKRQINRIFGKVRARRAKFLKNRPTWVVVPASSDVDDKLNARATGKVLDYLWRKLRLESKFSDALAWAETSSHGYWWFGWDPDAIGRVKLPADPATGAPESVQEGVVGEVTVEVGSPFELVVGDPTASRLAYQYEIIRAKERTMEYVQSRYPDRGLYVKPEAAGDTFQYENQIAALGGVSSTMMGGISTSTVPKSKDQAGNPNTVVVKEYFCRPTMQYPKGRYCVVAGGTLLKNEEELPFGLWDLENPFPCVEFADVNTAGQYWCTTVLEQMIDIQREYNGIRSMISTQIRLMGHPKVFVAKQHQIPDGAWTPDAGEIIEYNARPGLDKPFVWEPPNIVSDAWRMIDLIKSEFDDITQIYPASEGKTAGTESGFHANLLQEATDMVHGPDSRAHEMTIEEAAVKIRRVIKMNYDVPRLITVTSSSYQPEIFEFCSEGVDDYADIVVQAGSALPQLKGARIQAALDLYSKGVLGDPMDPEVRRRLLNVLDMGGMEDIYEYARVDEDMINIENATAEDGTPLSAPRFFEDHTKHWTGHINRLKSPAIMNWPPPARMALLAHAIEHAKYINHAAAYQMSIEAGLEGLIPPPMVMGLPGMPPAVPGDPNVMPPPGAAGPMPAAPPPDPQQSFAGSADQTPAAGTPSQ